MGFYIRKAFSKGPIRLNLSKSGLGLSSGVKGLRLGTGPRGRYVHAGRKGLYYRQSLEKGKNKGKRSKSEVGGGLGILGVIISICLLTFLINWFIENPTILLSLLVITTIIIGAIYFREIRRKSSIKNYKTYLDNCFVLNSQPVDDVNLKQILNLKSKISKDQKLRQKVNQIEKSIYDALLDKILDDKCVTNDEKQYISLFESTIQLDENFINETKREIFRSYYLEAVANHKITKKEIDELKGLITGLSINSNLIKDDLETVKEIIRAQSLTLPLPPVISPPIKIQKSETAYYFENGKVLTRRKAGRKEDTEYKYSVKRDGKFVITDKRVLVVDAGTTAIKLGDIVDVDVDIDSKMIFLSKSTSSKPLIIQSQEPLYAGRIIDLLMQ